MRLLLFILGVCAVVVCIEKPAAAQNYPWCAYYGPHFGATNCGFATFQQCLAAVDVHFGGTDMTIAPWNFRFWPKADIRSLCSRVRFRE